MRSRAALLTVLAALAATPLHAQPPTRDTIPPATPDAPGVPVRVAARPAPSAQEEKADSTKSPFDFSFGPQDDGGVGAVLKGSNFYPLGGRTAGTALFSPFVGLEVDAGWSSNPDALNNSSLSLKPAFSLSRLGRRNGMPTTSGPWLYVFGDARTRFGRFKQEGEDEDPADVSQTMLGGGVQLRWTGVDRIYAGLDSTRRPTRLQEPPSITLTYYTVQSTSADDDAILPEGVTADVVQATLRSELTIPFQCTHRVIPAPPADPDDPFAGQGGWSTTCPWTLDLRLTGTQPMTGGDEPELLADVGIIYDTGGKLKPVIRYRSGAEHGLEYDRQLLLGMLWEFVQ